MSNRYAVILSGGSGTRLWPVSRSLKPKQLLPLNGDFTLLQQTILRVCQKVNPKNLITVTYEGHRFEVKGQIAELYPEAVCGVMCEPVAKNTLPAISIAVKRILSNDPTALIGVFASDHSIDNEKAFFDAWDTAESAAEAGYLTLMGIKPTFPATGYGYIKPENNLYFKAAKLPVMKVASFEEKPDLVTAQKYINEGCLWNSGIFVFRADAFMEMLEKYQPLMFSQVLALNDDNFNENYHHLESTSIDYALAEKAEAVAVVPVDMTWSDLGNWESIYQRQLKDNQGNALRGEVVATDTKNSLLWAESGVLSTLGVDNLIVVRTADVTMVCERSRVEDVKSLVNEIQIRYPDMADSHLKVQRPWGTYTVLEEGPNFKIKSINVKPHEKLSLQLHQHRSEHWVVVCGTATVINDDKIFEVKTNESTYISAGHKHRLENNTSDQLIIIEIQTGDLLSELDILRFDDIYGR